jgi:hypothetical protein
MIIITNRIQCRFCHEQLQIPFPYNLKYRYTKKVLNLANNAFANGTAKFKTNYIEVPVLLVSTLALNALDHMQLTW